MNRLSKQNDTDRSPRPVRAALFAAGAAAMLLHAITASAAVIPISNTPLFLGGGVDPRIMLNLSNDHQLYFKAFDDYSDLDGDGAADTTYTHAIDYFGYFDPDKCYAYQNGRFEPQAFSADKYCDAVAGDWSGNFLNWASMTRIDVVRKILYGGSRSTDSSTQTVLERTYLPNDAHSFAKYYNGTDIDRLTPFTGVPNSDPVNASGESPNGITICNTTDTSTRWSQDVTDPPLMRVAEGNYSLWASNERFQCLWSEATVLSGNRGTNGNDPAQSEIEAHSDSPSEIIDGLGNADYNVRVEVCVDDGTTDLIRDGEAGDANEDNNEKCVIYPDGNYKPTGLLQQYGDDESIQFGMMTGSYGANKSGGVLRKNTGSFADEINTDTDGSFKAQPATGGIIATLEAFRIFGYDHTDGRYNNAGGGSGDNCPWGLSSFNDGRCTNWGNPQSELFLESLRYFAGADATNAFNVDDSGFISGLVTATWEDPIDDTAEYCAPLRVLQFNASTSSYDGDQLGGVTEIGMTDTGDLDAETNAVGDGEGITGNEFFVGETAGDQNQLCTAKTVNGLANVAGTCPDAPRLEGTYQIAGLAKYAHLNDIRSDRQDEQTVDTYGVSLTPAVPKVTIPVPNSSNEITIQPACRNSDLNPDANCAIVDFKIAEQNITTGTGKLYVNWEDSEQGGDFDSDMWGVIEYSIDTAPAIDEITVTTDVIDESTIYDMGFGYVISGTTADGFHAHSGIEGFDYVDPTIATGCSDCQVGNGPTSVTYPIGGSTAENLEVPLFYAAKWGGFEDQDDDGTPNQQSEWDLGGDGSPDTYFFAQDPGALAESLSNAFLGVTERESSSAAVALNSQSFSTDSRLYQARFNSEDWSGQLLAFEIESTPSPDGQRLLLSVADTPLWDASELLDNDSPNSRRIIAGRIPASPGDPNGVPFRWPADPNNPQPDELSSAQVAALNVDPDDVVDDGEGEDRLLYLRGDRSNENAAKYRERGSVLGDLINSAPVFVGAPRFLYPDNWDDFTIAGDEALPEDANPYSEFFLANDEDSERIEMVYVGGNDGMVHGFDAETGEEKIAFVPSKMFSNLNELTSPNYEHLFYVDGSPTYADAYFDDGTPGWRSILTGGFNAGGQGIYALDITDPNSQFTESAADDIVLWEFTDADDADMGYSFSKPNVVRMKNGEWAAVFGNGYNNTDNQVGDSNVGDGTAALYVVDIEDGTLIRKIDTNFGSSSEPNGLSTVAPVDVDGDFIVDRAYAGDLEGNLWKFDLSDSDPSNWDVVKVFETEAEDPNNASQTVTQPITVRPQVGPHPSGQDGFMVYFGTGKYIGAGDADTVDQPTQTFYAVLDVTKSNGQQIEFTKADLLEQKIVEEVVVDANNTPSDPSDDSELRITSDNEISNWFDPDGTGPQTGAVGGWYMDLLNTQNDTNTNNFGEKAVTDPLLRSGRIIFTTLIPSPSPCDFGGTGWLMELDADDGGLLGIPPFDLNDDVTFGSDDQYNGQSPGGIKSDVGIIPVPAIMLTPGNTEAKFMSGSTGSIQSVTESSGTEDRGRQSWEELR